MAAAAAGARTYLAAGLGDGEAAEDLAPGDAGVLEAQGVQSVVRRGALAEPGGRPRRRRRRSSHAFAGACHRCPCVIAVAFVLFEHGAEPADIRQELLGAPHPYTKTITNSSSRVISAWDVFFLRQISGMVCVTALGGPKALVGLNRAQVDIEDKVDWASAVSGFFWSNVHS